GRRAPARGRSGLGATTVAAMAQRVAEHVMRQRRFGPKVILRVDLHGVSTFGPGDRKTLIRWEWVEAVTMTDDGGVEVRSANDVVRLPKGAFGFEPSILAERLE